MILHGYVDPAPGEHEMAWEWWSWAGFNTEPWDTFDVLDDCDWFHGRFTLTGSFRSRRG